MKRVISVVCLSMLVFSMTVPLFAVGADGGENSAMYEPEPIRDVDVEIDYDSAEYGENGVVYYDILNVEELAAAYDIAPEKVRSMKYVELPAWEYAYGANPVGLFEKIEIVNAQYVGNVCLNRLVAQHVAQNMTDREITKTVTFSETVSNTYSLTVESGIEVDPATIGSSVGFNVTGSQTVTDTTSVVLQPWETMTVVAFPYCEMYSYDVNQWKLLQGTRQVGSGYAYKVIAYCVTTYVN